MKLMFFLMLMRVLVWFFLVNDGRFILMLGRLMWCLDLSLLGMRMW